MTTRTIKTLVLSGGGTKGMAYVGVFRALQELQQIHHITKIIGTSIGALASLIIALKFSISEMTDLMLNFDVSAITDINIHSILKAPTSFGLDSGEKFSNYVKALIASRGIPDSITLLELYNKTKLHLIITATCIEDYKCVYLDHETIPDMPVWLAVRMSCNVPLVFAPLEYKEKHYLDGGIIDNLPIQYADGNLDSTLGFELQDDFAGNELSNPINYVLALVKCLYSNGLAYNRRPNYKDNIVNIKIEKMIWLNTDLSKDKIQFIIDSGYKLSFSQINAFLDKPIEPPPPTHPPKDSPNTP